MVEGINCTQCGNGLVTMLNDELHHRCIACKHEWIPEEVKVLGRCRHCHNKIMVTDPTIEKDGRADWRHCERCGLLICTDDVHFPDADGQYVLPDTPPVYSDAESRRRMESRQDAEFSKIVPANCPSPAVAPTKETSHKWVFHVGGSDRPQPCIVPLYDTHLSVKLQLLDKHISTLSFVTTDGHDLMNLPDTYTVRHHKDTTDAAQHGNCFLLARSENYVLGDDKGPLLRIDKQHQQVTRLKL